MTDAIEHEDLNSIADAIDQAEEVPDPLDGLVEKCAAVPGAAFTPDVLGRLAALKNENRAAFETLRAELKKTGCRVTALDEAIAEETGGGERRPTQVDILIDLAAKAQLFHTSDSTAFADIEVGEHRETWPVRAKGFRRWLAHRFFVATGGAPSAEALQAVLNVVEAKAHFDGPELPAYIRVGGLDGRLYLDLCDEAWRAVEIDAGGWRVIDEPPVRFRRAAGMLPLPMPVPGGSIKNLRSFLNVRADNAKPDSETALWSAGPFGAAYSGNRDAAVADVIDANPVAAAVRAIMDTQTEWSGTASDLLGALARVADERTVKAKSWPETPRALSGRLRRAAPSLRKIGIEIITGEREGHARTRTIHITRTPSPAAPDDAKLPSPSSFSGEEGVGYSPSAPSASGNISGNNNWLMSAGLLTVADGAGANRPQPNPTVRTTVRANP